MFARETASFWRENEIAGHRHSTKSFSENVLGNSYQMLEVLSFCDRERAKLPLIKITVFTFSSETSTRKLSGVSIF